MRKDPFLKVMEESTRDLCESVIKGIVSVLVSAGFLLSARNRRTEVRVFYHPQLFNLRITFDPRRHTGTTNRKLPCLIAERTSGTVPVEIDRVNFFCINGSDPDVIVGDAEDFLQDFMTKYRELNRKSSSKTFNDIVVEDSHAVAG